MRLGENVSVFNFGDTSISFYRKNCVKDLRVFEGDELDFLETSNTESLEVKNFSDYYVLILPGSVVSWVSQDRTVRYPVVVPPFRDGFDEVFKVSVRCSESGQGFRSGFGVDGVRVAPFSMRFKVGYLDQGRYWGVIRDFISGLLDAIDSLMEVPDVFRDYFGYRESLFGAINSFLAVLYNSKLLSDLGLLKSFALTLSDLVASFEREVNKFDKSDFWEKEENRSDSSRVESWFRIISNMCLEMVSKLGQENFNMRGFYADLFGLLIPNRPKHLDAVWSMKVNLFLVRFSDLLGKYTGLGRRVVDEFPLSELYHNIHYDLADKAYKLIVDHYSFLMDVYRLAESFIGGVAVYSDEDSFLSWKDRVGIVYSRIYNIVSRLKESVKKLDNEIKGAIIGVKEYLLDPSFFGLRLPENVNAVGVWSNGDLVYYEWFPCYISGLLWKNLFTSLFLDGVVKSKWSIGDEDIETVKEFLGDINDKYPSGFSGRVYYDDEWLGYRIYRGKRIVYEFFVRREGELDYGWLLETI